MLQSNSGKATTVSEAELPISTPTGHAGDGRHAEIREELERVLADPLFKNSKRYPGLLRYVVEQALQGRAEQIKERTIGVEVFGRDADYDTNVDHVVRNTASEVRKRLAQHYHQARNASAMTISLPVGSYVPEFQIRGEKLPALAPPIAVIAQTHRKRTRWPFALAGAAILALIAGLIVERARVRGTALDEFWNPVLASSNSLLICLGPSNPVEPSVAMEQFSTAHTGRLPSGSAISLYDLQAQPTQHVALSDAIALSRVASVIQAKGGACRIRSAPFTSLNELREGPAVLIGAFTNRWSMELMEPMRFHMRASESPATIWIEDRQNPGRRQWVVHPEEPYIDMTEDYAIVSRVRDPTTEQFLVIAAGIGIFGSTASGEFLSRAEYLARIAEKAPPNWQRMNVEAVIATRLINGNAGPPRLLAVHFW